MSNEQPHDALFKSVFGRLAAAREFIAVFLPSEIVARVDLDSLRIEPSNSVTDRLGQRIADLLFSIRVQGELTLIQLLLEHKSSPDPLMILDLYSRSAIVLHDWARRHPRATQVPFVLPIVVYHGPSPCPTPLSLRDVFLGGPELTALVGPWLPHFPVVLIDLSQQPEGELARLLAADAAAGLGLWLLKWGRHREFEERILEDVRWLRAALHSGLGERVMAPMLRYTFLMIAARGDPSEFAAKLGQRIGHEAEVMARNLYESIVETGIKTGIERGLAQGIEQGIEEGLERGRTLGSIEARANAIVTFLENRFAPLPKRIREAILSQTDTTFLERWIVAAARAPSLEAFEHELRALPREREDDDARSIA